MFVEFAALSSYDCFSLVWSQKLVLTSSLQPSYVRVRKGQCVLRAECANHSTAKHEGSPSSPVTCVPSQLQGELGLLDLHGARNT